MRRFLGAIAFLTVLPVPKDVELKGAPLFFPVVGCLIGLILFGINVLLRHLFGEAIGALGTLLVLIALTRGLHLDGLADTLDALFSAKDTQGALEVMRDPHLGAFGVLGLVCLLLLKFHLIMELQVKVSKALLVFPVLGRLAPLFPMWALPYLRQEGKAKALLPLSLKAVAVGCFFSWAFCLWALGWKGTWLVLSSIGFSLALCLFFHRKFKGVTGDILGAFVELTEAFVLLVLRGYVDGLSRG